MVSLARALGRRIRQVGDDVAGMVRAAGRLVGEKRPARRVAR